MKRRMQNLRCPVEKGNLQEAWLASIKSSLRCATTKTAGLGWIGHLLRGTAGGLVSWGTGLDSENLATTGHG